MCEKRLDGSKLKILKQEGMVTHTSFANKFDAFTPQ
jgi:hypothetical protein